MKLVLNYMLGLILLTSLASCEKTEGFTSLTDNKADVPVTVTNAQAFRPGPTVFASMADGKIQIVLAVPAGRTIKEITRVAISTTYTKIQGTTGFYNTAPIPGNGNTVTFNTTFTEYTSKGGGSSFVVNSELSNRFYFLLTLDDGSTIIPTDVRVLVQP